MLNKLFLAQENLPLSIVESPRGEVKSAEFSKNETKVSYKLI